MSHQRFRYCRRRNTDRQMYDVRLKTNIGIPVPFGVVDKVEDHPTLGKHYRALASALVEGEEYLVLMGNFYYRDQAATWLYNRWREERW